MNGPLIDPFLEPRDWPDTVIDPPLRSGFSVCTRFNRSGDYLAAGRADGTVVIFDIETMGVARKLKGHVRQVTSLSWSRNGRYLLTSSQDWRCIIWDLQNGRILRSVRFEAAVYIAELHPRDHLKFVVALYDEMPLFIDATNPEPVKMYLPTAPKRIRIDDDEKQAAQDAKMNTTVTVFTASGDHVITGTSKGWLNIIEVATRTVLYSTKICTGVIIYLRLTSNGRDIVVNASDRIIRTIPLPNLASANLNPDTINMEVEHKFQDVVNRLSWNHVCFSSTGEYVCASTYNNHDVLVWERRQGSLVKILEGLKEEIGVVEWHPHRPFVVLCGLESGSIHVWSIIPQQRWSALAPDFVEVEENVLYQEREDEFDIHDKEEIHKRRLDAEDEDVDVLSMEPLKSNMDDEEEPFKMPVQYDLIDSEAEEEFVTVGRGEMRRKSPTEGRDYTLDADVAGSDDSRKPNGKSMTKRKR